MKLRNTPRQQFPLTTRILAHTVLLIISCLLGACGNKPGFRAVDAEDALATFQVADGFRIEMIASEPLITSPVDMEIDEFGNLYVVEMPGYPLDKSGTGKIILLSDTNGDGKMDKRTVFKDNLVLPNGILRWKKGVLVTDAPNVLYLEDTDGDGTANLVDTLITGFALTNPQHNMNSPVYGLDNWIYIANEGSVPTTAYKEEFGDEGSEILFHGQAGTPMLPKNANGRSVRFRPDYRQMEMLSSRCQFGLTFTAWGQLLACNNSNHAYQEVIANRYFERNPDLMIAEATQNLSDHLDAAEVFPTTTRPDRQLLTNVGVMTSACGLTAYTGAGFPDPYDKNIVFIAEPVSNLVHVDVLSDSGATFTASRVIPSGEFLSSTDAWSRPVNMYVGPDGALYVLDYYRRVIESPEWMSEEAINAGNLYDGMDKGRIFRIVPENAPKATWTQGLDLGKQSDGELVSLLANPNGWWRMHAQRLLVDHHNKDVIPDLVTMTTHVSPLGRLHALWTLEGLGALELHHIEAALKDSVAGVRENAIRLAELHMDDNPELHDSLIGMQYDKDPKVKFQLMLTMGYFDTPQASEVRNDLLFANLDDNWMQVAALSASSTQTAPLLKVVLEKFREDIPAYVSLVERLTAMVGAGGKDQDIGQLLHWAMTSNRKEIKKKASVLRGLERGLKSRKVRFVIPPKDQELLTQEFFRHSSSDMRQACYLLLKLNGLSDPELRDRSIAKAAEIAIDTTQSAQRRAEAIRFISVGQADPYQAMLKGFLGTREEYVVQAAALETLKPAEGLEIAEYITQQWPVLSPAIRDNAIQFFMADSSRLVLLIDALETNKINPGYISFANSVQLMQNPNENLRNRARKLFTKTQREAETINKAYRKALTLEGNAKNGKQIFVQNCAICHQVRGKDGISVGPDLGTVHNWIKEDIMAAILNPGLSIASGFDLWKVELNNGESILGIIASETSGAIILRNSLAADRIINRQDIQSLQSLNASAMPTGFETKISQQEMADLLAFLRQH